MQFCFLLFALFGANGFFAANHTVSFPTEITLTDDAKVYVTSDAAVFSKDSIFSSHIVQSSHKELVQVYVDKGANVYGENSLYADAVFYHEDQKLKTQLAAKTKAVKLREKQIRKIPLQDSDRATANVFVRVSDNESSFFVLQKAGGCIATGFSSYSNGFINPLLLFSLDKRKFFNLSIKSIILINATNFKKLGLKISRPPPFFSFV